MLVRNSSVIFRETVLKLYYSIKTQQSELHLYHYIVYCDTGSSGLNDYSHNMISWLLRIQDGCCDNVVTILENKIHKNLLFIISNPTSTLSLSNVKLMLLHNNIWNRHLDTKSREYLTHTLKTHLTGSMFKLGLPEIQRRRELVI